MSLSSTKLVWQRSRATGNARLIMLALADYANERNECWPSIARLSKMCRISERSVLRNLAELEAAGEVVRTTKRGATTRYRITLTHDASVTPDATVTSDASVTRHMTPASPTHDASVTQSINNHYKNHTPPIIPPCNGDDGYETADDGRNKAPRDGGKGGGVASAIDGESAKGKAGGGRNEPRRNNIDPWNDIRLTAARRDIARANGIAADEIDRRFVDFIRERQASAAMVREPDEDWRRYCAKHGRHRSPNSASAGGRSRAADAFREALARRQAKRMDMGRGDGDAAAWIAPPPNSEDDYGCGEVDDPVLRIVGGEG